MLSRQVSSKRVDKETSYELRVTSYKETSRHVDEETTRDKLQGTLTPPLGFDESSAERGWGQVRVTSERVDKETSRQGVGSYALKIHTFKNNCYFISILQRNPKEVNLNFKP